MGAGLKRERPDALPIAVSVRRTNGSSPPHSKLKNETDIDHKTKTWISYLLSEVSPDTTFIPIPQWLLQIVNTTQSCCNDLIDESSQLDRTFLKRSSVSSITNQGKKMRIFPLKSPTIARNSSSYLFKYILNEANIIVSDDFTQYITIIKLMAELQNIASNPTRDNHLITSKTDIVSIFHKTTITSIEFQSLVENQWISHEVVNLLSKIIQQENKTIHVYSSHFMNQYMMQADDLRTFHVLI